MSKVQQDKEVAMPDFLIKELLTKSEMRMIKHRFEIIHLRQEGYSIREIAKKIAAGTDTVTRIIKIAKMKRLLKDRKEVSASSAKWVFGKVGTKE